MTTTSTPTQPRPLTARVMTAARAVASREPGLIAVGLGGIALAATCLTGVLVGGRVVPPEGDLRDAATFDFGVGVFAITVALLLPWAGYTPTARRRWRRASYVFLVYGLVLETVQAFRGLDPRFTEAGDDVDELLGLLFGATAGLNTVLFVLLAVRFFRGGVLADRAVLRLGVRYGVTAVVLSFGVGIAMSVANGRQVGKEGNLLLAHAIGVHGLQALPLVALLVLIAHRPGATARVHTAGVGWLTACMAALVQAGLGHPPFDASLLSVVLVAGLVTWATVAAGAVLMWRKAATGLVA